MAEQDYFLTVYREFEVHDVVVGGTDEVDVLVADVDSCTFYKVDRSDIGQELLDLFRKVYGGFYPDDPFGDGMSDSGEELLDLFHQAYGEPSYYNVESVTIRLTFELRAEDTLTSIGVVLHGEEVQKAKDECEKAYSWTDAPRWPDGPEGISARLYDRAERWECLVRQRMARQDEGEGLEHGLLPGEDAGSCMQSKGAPKTSPVPSRLRRGPKPEVSCEDKTYRYLRDHPDRDDITCREIAQAIGYGHSTVAKTKAWKVYQRLREVDAEQNRNRLRDNQGKDEDFVGGQ